MKKWTEACRKLLYATSLRRIGLGVGIVAIACLMAFFSQDVVFYPMDTSAAAYTMEVQSVSDGLPGEIPMDFYYDGDRICLVTDGAVPQEEVAVYAATRFGAAKLTQENMDCMDETYLGAFAAVWPTQSFDIDGDGQNENVFYTLKTDLREVQGADGSSPVFRDKKIVMEIALESCENLTVYFQTKPLLEREVTVYRPDGSTFVTTTDSLGNIYGLSLNEIRQGVTVEYAPNGLSTYRCRYVPEVNGLGGRAILPLLTLLCLSVGAVGLCVLLRDLAQKKKGRTRKSGKVRRTYKPAFVIARWCVMFVSFLLLTWGGSVLGYWFEELYIPVLSCSKYNPEQLVASSCYYMSHLNILFTLEPQKIIVFFVCFFIPLFLFGKLFCGFICPMGFVQDVIHAARQKTGIQGVTLTQKLYERLSIIKWTAVMLFLGMGFAGLDFCNICPVVTLSPAFSGFKTTIYISGFVMLFVLVASFFKSRFFCNICPLGLIMGLFHRFTLVRLQKDCTACTECGACYNACPMGIKSIYTEREKINVTDTNCLFCGECVRNCPEDNALTITLAGVKLYGSSREKFMKRFDRKEAAKK